MRLMKKKIVMLGMIMVMGASCSTALAASAYKTPADAAAGLTGRTIQEVITERNVTGKSYGTIASEAGKLDEFKKEVLEMKKDFYASLVNDGSISQEEADEAIAAIESRQAICDGSGTCGYGNGRYGRGRGMGQGLRNGSCAWRS